MWLYENVCSAPQPRSLSKTYARSLREQELRSAREYRVPPNMPRHQHRGALAQTCGPTGRERLDPSAPAHSGRVIEFSAARGHELHRDAAEPAGVTVSCDS